MKRAPRPVPAPELSAELIQARGALDVVDGVDVLGEWQWQADEGCWTLSCRLTIPVVDAQVPRRTDWVVIVEPSYPWGYIHIQPAVRNAIERTFPHQLLNRPPDGQRPWRTGRICVDTGVRTLGRQGVDREPYSAADRLLWRLERARRWLLAAACGELFRSGDPFELPDFNTPPIPLVAFGENPNSLATWQGEAARYGVASLTWVGEHPQVLAVTTFQDMQGREVYAPRWGMYITAPGRPRARALWIRLDGTPHLAPWQAPMTWGEFRAAAAEQGTSVDDVLRAMLDEVRDGEQHVLLVGFPIPAMVGGAHESYFWQAMNLPAVPADTGKPRKGFRPGKAPKLDITQLAKFQHDAPVRWLRSENWHEDTVAARGRLPEALTTAEVLVVGAGALGSAIAEMLVRGGVRRLTVCDGDAVMAGNLVRHTLTLADVGRFKADALAEHLNAASPHAEVRAITHAFPPTDDTSLRLLRTVDVVIDCTGENAVAHALSAFPWNSDKVFASVSLGLNASAGFSFICFRESFPRDGFLEALRPWLDRQADAFKDAEWPREGVGCWHPVFPARGDEVWLLAAAAVQHLAEAVPRLIAVEPQDDDDGELVVFERVQDGGLRRARSPAHA